MAYVDKVAQMQQQGMSDNDIIKTLKNEGISPKDISDSISQAKIKMAVSQDTGQEYQESYGQPAPEPQQEYAPQQYAPQQYIDPSQQQYADPNQQQYSYPDQNQSQMSIETITEIVDRIISEKLKEIGQKIKPVVDFKNKAEDDINELKERLKRIELTIDGLQRAIIGKIGEFGQSNALIHKDLENLHGTVSKLMNPLIDNYNELKKTNSKK